jgi:hypothetical protein
MQSPSTIVLSDRAESSGVPDDYYRIDLSKQKKGMFTTISGEDLGTIWAY